MFGRGFAGFSEYGSPLLFMLFLSLICKGREMNDTFPGGRFICYTLNMLLMKRFFFCCLFRSST